MNNDSKAVAEFLGIDAAEVEETSSVSTPEGTVVHVLLRPQGRECPHCRSENAEARGRVPKKLKHSLFISRKVLFVHFQRKYRCRECGRSFYEPNPFSARNAKVTVETERLVLEMLSDYNATYASVAKALHVSNTAVIDIFDRRYEPRRGRLPKVLCIDECYGMGQFKKPYCLMLLDWKRKRLIDVLEGRDLRIMRDYFFEIPESERASVECVSIDMYEPYLQIAEGYFKNAVACVDSFHVMENLTRALDKVRCRVMNGWPTDSDEYHYLKKYHWALFRDDLDPNAKRKRDQVTKRWLNPYEAVRIIRGISPDLSLAHDYYLSYKLFNSKPRTAEEATERLDELRKDPSVASIREMATFMETLTNWRHFIVNSFTFEADGRRISNGPIEGFNSQYKKLMRVSNGLKNFRRFRARLMLCSSKDFAFSPPKKGSLPRKRVGKKRGKYKKGKGGSD